MLPETLERVRPVCPACRGQADGPGGTALLVRDEAAHTEQPSGEILQGTLRCTWEPCGERYPIIDGVAILVPEPVRYLEAYRHEVCDRRDLLPLVQDFLDRGYSFADQVLAGRRYLSQYATAHYAPGMHGTMDELVAAALGVGVGVGVGVGDGVGGRRLVLDLGCATGRWTLVAARAADFAVGMDLDFAMVRAAREVRAAGKLAFARWVGGRRFGRGEVTAPELRGARADFFVADALRPPVAPGTADVLLALNLTDNVPAPEELLRQMGALLRPGGRFLHSTPYRWNSAVTPPEKQLDPVRLRAALASAGLVVAGEARAVSWSLPGAPGESTELTVEVLGGVRAQQSNS
ncbi:MAG TPA: methyltransferase domain-containing protein [Myxococcota bacterium]|nr:methyltransferase domain-containing protein [Myxococcota bacterium]